MVIKIITEKQSLFLRLLDVPCVLYHQAAQEDHRNHGRPVKDTDINITIISLWKVEMHQKRSQYNNNEHTAEASGSMRKTLIQLNNQGEQTDCVELLATK